MIYSYRFILFVFYCIVFIHCYSASNSMSLSEALPTTEIDTVSEFTRRRQLKVKDLHEDPYVAHVAGFELTTLRSKGICSTNASQTPHISCDYDYRCTTQCYLKITLHVTTLTRAITLSGDILILNCGSFIRSFIRSGHFYSAPSSPLLLRGAPDYSTDTVSEFHAEAHRQLQVKDLPRSLHGG